MCTALLVAASAADAQTVTPPKQAARSTLRPSGPSPAIGPKQDDPCGHAPATGSASAGGQGMLTIGPKQDDPAQPRPTGSAGASAGGQGMLAIGPKQDDPVGPKPTVSCPAPR
jgi:hypothetical protein